MRSAEDSNYINCAPSYAFREGSMSNSSVVQGQEPVLYTAISQGWIVVSSGMSCLETQKASDLTAVIDTDYEGPDSAFGSGRQSGQ